MIHLTVVDRRSQSNMEAVLIFGLWSQAASSISRYIDVREVDWRERSGGMEH